MPWWEYKPLGQRAETTTIEVSSLLYKSLCLHVTAHPLLEHHVTDRWTGSETQRWQLLKRKSGPSGQSVAAQCPHCV